MSIRNNTLANLAGQLAPVAVTLLTVPPYLALIGEARYGVLAICWMLLGYFGLFDLGLGRATAQRIAALRDAPSEERSQLLWTALFLNACLGLFAAAVFRLAGQWLLTRFIPGAGSLHSEALAALPWLAACLPIAIFSSALAGALQGRERFVALNWVQGLGSVFGQILPLTAAWLGGPELVRLIPAALLARLITTLLLMRQCRHHVPLSIRPSVGSAWMRPLFTFGGWFAVTASLDQLLQSTDRLLIGAVAGVQAVTHYSVPFGLISRAIHLPASLSNALFPRFAWVNTSQRIALEAEAIQAVSVAMAPAILVGLFCMEPFLAVWINPEFAQRSARAGEIMLLGLWAIALAQIPYALIQARGRPDIVAKFHLAELFPYFAMLYGAVVLWGATGAAVAWAVRGAVATLILFILAGTRGQILRPLVFPTALITVAAAATFCFPYTEPSRWASATMLLAVSAIWTWKTAPPSIRNLLSGVRRRSARVPTEDAAPP